MLDTDTKIRIRACIQKAKKDIDTARLIITDLRESCTHDETFQIGKLKKCSICGFIFKRKA